MNGLFDFDCTVSYNLITLSLGCAVGRVVAHGSEDCEFLPHLMHLIYLYCKPIQTTKINSNQILSTFY